MPRPPIQPFPRVLAVSLLLVGVPVLAQADDRPATWDMSLAQLKAHGLGQYRGDPVPVPAAAPRVAAPTDPIKAKQGVLFVNFDGASLTSGYDDARSNVTQISNLVGSFAPYGSGSKRDAVMQAVRTDWEAYNVIITDARPASGDYTMNMTGPTNPFGGGVLGIAPLDCNDSQTHNNITYAFHSSNDPFSAAVTATTIGQEVAHSYGLEHVNEPGDIMNPTNSGGDASFRDTCIQIVSNQGIACGQQHATHCGSGSAQNAHQELLTLFGTAVPDTQSPSVQIVAPRDGEAFDVGASFEIEVEAQDDTAIEIVRLYNNGAALDSDASEPYGWSVSDIPEGTYELYVEATDLAGNLSTSNVVTVVVGPPGAADGGTDDDGGGGDSGGTDDGGSESAGLPDMFGEDADDQGCGCGYAGGTDREPGRWAALLALMGLSFVRRRRAA